MSNITRQFVDLVQYRTQVHQDEIEMYQEKGHLGHSAATLRKEVDSFDKLSTKERQDIKFYLQETWSTFGEAELTAENVAPYVPNILGKITSKMRNLYYYLLQDEVYTPE